MAEDNLPPVRDVKDYKFQQLCKVQIRNAVPSDEIKGLYSLIDSSSKYGLTFVGTSTGFNVIRTQEFLEQDAKHASDRLQHIITDIPTVASVDVGQQVTHLGLSCDGLNLAVGITDNGRSCLNVYDTRRFVDAITSPVTPFVTFKLCGGESVSLLDMAWNPAQPTLLVICMSNGQLDMLNISTKLDVRASKPQAKAKCVCWSPKGRQVVAGIEGGRLVQYDYNLDVKREWDCPPMFQDGSFSAISVAWLATYTFLAGYMSSNAASSDQPNLILINGSKDGPTTYDDYEDICFGTGEERPKKYFFNFIQQWEMVITGSSNASEIAVMAKHLDQKQVWEQWTLDDAGRAECPLTSDYVDTYPLGMTVDFSSQTPIRIDDERSHPPSPLMLILSTAGYIIPYHCMYLHKDAPVITTPPDSLTNVGCRQNVGGPAATTQTSNTFGGAPSAVKNLFGTGTGTANPTFSANVPGTSADSTAKPSFGSTNSGQGDTKSPFTGFGQTDGQSSFTPKFTAPAPATASFTAAPSSTQSTGFGGFGGFASKTAPSFGSLSSGTTPTFGSSSIAPGAVPTFGSLSSTVGTAPTFGSLSSTSGTAPTFGSISSSGTAPTFGSISSTASSTPTFGSVSSAPVSAPAFGSLTSGSTTPTFGSLGSAQKPAMVPSVKTQAPSFGYAQTSGAEASSFSFKPTGPVAADSVGTGFATTSITTPGTFNFSTKSSGPSTGSNSTVPPASMNAGTSLLGRPTKVSQGQSLANPAGFSFTLGTGGNGGPAVSQRPTAGGLNKSSTQPSVTQGEEPAPPSEGTLSKSPTFAPPPSYQAYAPPPAYNNSQSSKRGATEEPTLERGATQDPALERGAVNQADDTVDRSFAKSIQEEILHFEKELLDLKTRAGKSEFVIGTKEEMIMLRKKTEEMGKFCDDIKKTVKEQNKDVEEQTTLCLDMFSMVEECRVRQQLNSDPKYKTLLKSRALDSASAEKLEQLQQQNQALDQGLRDVDLILDTQWEEYQNKKKIQSRRIKAPTNDAIYRVVKSNHNLIQAQKAKLQDVEERLKQLKLYNKTSTWNNTAYSAGESDVLSSLVDSLVEPRPTTSVSHVSSDSGGLRSSKMAQLREHLHRRHVPIIRSTKPENLSMSRLTARETRSLRSPQISPQKPTITQTSGRGSARETTLMGQGSTSMGQGSTSMGQGSTSMGQGFTSMGQGFTSMGQGSTSIGQGSTSMGQGSTSMGQGSTSMGQGFTSMGQGSTSMGQGSTSMGQGSTSMGQGSTSMGQGSTVFTGPQPGGIGSGTNGQPIKVPPQVLQASRRPPTAPKPSFGANGKTSGSSSPRVDSTPFAFTQQPAVSVQPQINVAQTMGQSFKGFGMEPGTGKFTGPKVSEVNGIKLEDITPSGSENDVESTEDDGEDEEYDEDESSEENETEFGSQYTVTGSQVTSTPVGFKPPTEDPVTPRVGSASTPVSRKLFGQGGSQGTGGGFQFGGDSTQITGFGFGTPGQPAGKQPTSSTPGVASSNAGSTNTGISTAGSNPATAGFSFTTGQPAKPNPAVTTQSSAKPDSGLQFGGKGGVGFNFGSSDSKSASSTSSGMTGLFGSKASGAATSGSTGSDSKTFSFGAAPTTSSTATYGSKAVPVSGFTSTSSSGGSSGAGFNFGSSSAPSQSGDKAPSGLAQPSSKSPFVQPSTKDDSAKTPTTTATLSVTTSVSTSATPTSSKVNVQPEASTQPDTFSLSQSKATTQPATFGFGQSKATTQPVTFGFGQSGGTSSAQSATPLFGQTATSTSSATGQPQSSSAEGTPSSKSGVGFGTSTAGPLFGQTATTSGSGVFGQTSTPSSTGLFGQPTSTTTSTSSFGQTATPSSTGFFGPPVTTSSTGLFGQPAKTTTGSGFFGQATTTSSTGLFGQTATTSSTGLFGQPTTTSSTGLFGQSTTTSNTGLFGQTATSASTGLFGQATTTSSSGPFGQTPTSGTGLFGSPSSGAGSSPFGQSSFGQTPSSGFGQTGSGSGSLFGKTEESGGSGGFFGGLGGKPSAEKAKTNVFGTTAFGSQAQTSSSGLFGSGSTSTFGTANSGGGGGAFSGGGGGFSSGGGGVGSTGFGAAQQPATGGGFGSSGFGGSPAFGGAPAFGSPPRFGVAPSMGGGSGFGVQPTFGAASPLGGGSTFGGGATFGSASASPSGGFAGFASAGSPTFGALAQATDTPSFQTMNPAEPTGFGGSAFGGAQQNPPAFGGNTFGSSPQFTGYRG